MNKQQLELTISEKESELSALKLQLKKLKEVPFQEGESALFTDNLEEEGSLYGFDGVYPENSEYPYSALNNNFNYKYVKRLQRFIYAEPDPNWQPKVGDVVWIKHLKEVGKVIRISEGGSIILKRRGVRLPYLLSEIQEFTMKILDEQS